MYNCKLEISANAGTEMTIFSYHLHHIIVIATLLDAKHKVLNSYLHHKPRTVNLSKIIAKMKKTVENITH